MRAGDLVGVFSPSFYQAYRNPISSSNIADRNKNDNNYCSSANMVWANYIFPVGHAYMPSWMPMDFAVAWTNGTDPNSDRLGPM